MITQITFSHDDGTTQVFQETPVVAASPAVAEAVEPADGEVVADVAEPEQA